MSGINHSLNQLWLISPKKKILKNYVKKKTTDKPTNRKQLLSLLSPLSLGVPADSPTCVGDVTVYVNKAIGLVHSFLFCSCVYFFSSLYGPFNCISFHKFSRKFPAFSLSSFGLTSALLALSTTYFFMSLPQRWLYPLWLTGLKASTN